MPNRPAIPIDVQRAVFIEAGHRCAVCGTPFPLERAHLVPWSRSKDHSAENLICLCANCHERADSDWDIKTLAEYKKNPWVTRHPAGNPTVAETTSVEIKIDLDLREFDDTKKRLLRYALASFLEIHPDSVQVRRVKPGSVKVSIELPSAAAHRLIEAFESGDTNLRRRVEPLQLEEVKLEPRRKPRVFISYGRNESRALDIARLCDQLHLQPIMFREAPASGRTVLEAFSDYVEDVDFAVVLLTRDETADADIRGYSRARANVIFELGYLLAKLGRDSVFLLQEPDIEIPSVALAMTAQPLDEAGEWRDRLAHRLRSAVEESGM